MKFIILLILFIPSICCADWTKGKIAREIFFAAALSNDWQQTRVIAKTPWRKEKNPILGKKPKINEVDTYFAVCLVGHVLIAYALPEPYAKMWQNIWIGIESNSVTNNLNCGHIQKVGMGYKITHTITF